MTTDLLQKTIIYPELSYKIVGTLFSVYNELGFGFSERVYQKAIAAEFRQNNIEFQEQVYAPLQYKTTVVGKYFLDFLVEKKIIVEIKKNERFTKKHIDQVNVYLKTTNTKLALLVNFGRDGVIFKRLVHIQ